MIKKLFAVLLLTGFACVSAFADDGGNITFKPANSEPVVFSHDYHMKSRGIKCAACHFQAFAQSADGFKIKKEKLNKRDFCEHCHNGMKSFDVTSTKNCVRCHKKQ
jgi:c(7)-type cytochrome triheme protein